MSEDEPTGHDDEHDEEFDREFKKAMADYEAAQAAAQPPEKILRPTFGAGAGKKSNASQPVAPSSIELARSLAEAKKEVALADTVLQILQAYYQKFEPDLYQKLMGLGTKVIHPAFSTNPKFDEEKKKFVPDLAFKLARERKLNYDQVLEKFNEKDALFRKLSTK